MIVLGILLALLGYFLLIPIVETIGFVLVVVGVILWLLGASGHAVAGRRYWF
jgi:hypothetical protein